MPKRDAKGSRRARKHVASARLHGTWEVRVVKFFLATTLLLTAEAWALENAKVLPQGVRRINIKSLTTDLARTYNDEGDLASLAQPLAKDITFENVLKGKQGLDNTRLRAFLHENNIPHEQVLGSLSADLKGSIWVIAPVVAYGLTERVTLAIAAPFYLARTEVALGYRANETNAQNFLNLLSSPRYNQVAAAREAYDSLSDGVAALNDKLLDNGYRQLDSWEDKAFGDITLAVKTSIVGDATSDLRLANLTGVVVPTGRVDDPDILTDIAFGDGSWDIFAGLMCDQQLTDNVFLNQFAKFTYQTETDLVVRTPTADEAIAVPKERLTLKPGNKLDLGVSVQWESESGLEMGLGYEFNRKQQDNYRARAAVQQELEKETLSQANNLEVKLGFSTIPAFKRKRIPIPLDISLQYKRVIDSPLLAANRNTPATQLFTLDMNFYF